MVPVRLHGDNRADDARHPHDPSLPLCEVHRCRRPWSLGSNSRNQGIALVSSPFIDVNRQPKSSADVREPPTLEPVPPRRRPWLRRSGVPHDPDHGCSPCAADCTGRLTVGMTRDFADGEASGAAPSHTCGTSGAPPQCSARWHFAWSGTWRRLVGARWRGPRRNIAGPLSFTGPLFDRPLPPASKCEHRADPVLQKTATPNHGKTKASPHRH